MKKCIHCGSDVEDECVKCLSCGNSLFRPTKICPLCNRSYPNLFKIHEKEMCIPCAANYFEKGIKDIIVLTKSSVDDYGISSSLGTESVNIVIGTGTYPDFFQLKSAEFEKMLADAKESAIKALKYIAFAKGANAVIGIDFIPTEFTGNKTGLIASGTLVSVESL